MLIAIFVGIISGVIGAAFRLLIQTALNTPGVYNQLGGHWYLVPPAIGLIAAAAHAASRALVAPRTREALERYPRTSHAEKRQALPDLFESFHYGVFILRPLYWLSRGLVSLLNAFLGGIFGIEGGVIEVNYATLPLFSGYRRLYIEEKQTFVICAIAASLGVAMGAPFAGTLIALELVHAIEARMRAGAVLAALTAYGTATLLQSTVLSAFFINSPNEGLNVLGSLFAGYKPYDLANLELQQWVLLSAVAAFVGVFSGLLGWISCRALAGGSEFFGQAFAARFRASHVPVRMAVAGLLMGLAVWLVPESFGEPWRLWEDLAWQRLSSAQAFLILASAWVLLVLAFSGWGSSGLFSPMLVLGALTGYCIGNVAGSSWTIPLAIAGAASALAATFRIPIAASALVLESGHDGPTWWLAILAVASATLVCRLLGAKPLHEALLEQRGIRVIGGRAANLLAAMTTSEAMYRDVKTILDTADLMEMREAAAASSHNFLGVVSLDGKYLGLLALERLPGRVRHVLAHDAKPADIHALERVVEIRDLIDTYSPTVLPTDNVEKALRLLESTPCVAVVDEDRMLRGFLFESSIAGRYKREIANTVIREG